jgi:hypothetical protein
VKHKFAVLIFTAFLFAIMISTSAGQQPQRPRQQANWQKQIDALNDAFKNGLMTQAEYDAKLKWLKTAAALQDAFNNGLLTPREYEAKLLALSGGSAAPAPGRVNITTRTRTVEIPDPAWGIVAARFQIPEDWSFDGILIRDEGCDFAPSLAWRASSPDGLYGVQMMPEFGSHWTDNPFALRQYRQHDCKLMEPLNPAEFLQYIVPFVRPDPTLGPVEPAPDAEQFQQKIDDYNRRAQAAFGTTPDSGGAVRSRIQYVYRGQNIEEMIVVHQQTFRTQTGLPRQQHYYNFSTDANVQGTRAPQGQLDEVMRILGPMLAGAFQATPEWMQRFQQKLANDTALNQAMLQRQADSTRAIMAQQAAALRNTLNTSNANFQKAQNDRFNSGQQQWQQHMDYMTRSAQAYTLYAGDNQLVRNRQTGEVSTVTNKYGTSAWQQDGSNNILLQNPNDVNPNLYLRGTYTQLENVDPMKPY